MATNQNNKQAQAAMSVPKAPETQAAQVSSLSTTTATPENVSAPVLVAVDVANAINLDTAVATDATTPLAAALSDLGKTIASEVQPIAEQVVIASVPNPTPIFIEVPTNISNLGKLVIQEVIEYSENMKPRKPISPEEGARHQVLLYRALMNTINNLEDDFTEVFSTILKLFEAGKDGVFHEMYVFRFMELVALPENDRKAFHRLLNLIKVGGPVKGREIALKQVDFTNTLKFSVTEAGRQRVMGYFGK